MIITTIVATIASAASPADMAANIEQELNKPQVSASQGAKLEDQSKMGASVNYTFSFTGQGSSMDDANSWD